MTGYEVQGRRRDAATQPVREDVRLAVAQDRTAAYAVANAMVADGFTAWIFTIDRRSGRKTYSLLDKLT